MDKLILIVEDQSDMRDALKTALEAAGFKTISAENGQVGLVLAKEYNPDLILMDLVMPIMGGHTMLKKLREIPERALTKVIIISALDAPEDRTEEIENDVYDYIVKSSTTLSEIVETAQKACSSSS